ncbi:MAG: isochorismatase hydrolase [Subtercola sp.]|nr:isochorismatase hydrolase [Subtercola sp.]
MTITTLDPQTALVVIDLQKGIVGLPAVHPIGGVLACATALTAAFRRRGLPVVLVNVTGGAPGRAERSRKLEGMPADWADLVPELNAQPGDLLVTKKTWGAFTDTGLEARLRTLGVTQLVLAGVATSVGVESTARHAFELGFNVTLAIDAMTDLDADAHANSVTRIFPKLGETGTTQAIIDLLEQGDA